MALQQIPGRGLIIPPLPEMYSGAAPGFAATLLIDATGEKAAMCGHVFNKDRASKTINKVHFRFGTITKAGGSGLTVSLQDVSGSTAPFQPDETQDQFRAIATGDASFATNTWYTTGLITSDGTDSGTKRTVAFGERLAVVVEYDGSGRLSSDSVIVSGLSSNATTHDCTATLKTGGTWASQLQIPNVVLEFSDGTFGTLEGSWPLTAVSSVAYKQDTAGSDEYCLEFTFPGPVRVDGGWAIITSPGATTGDFDMVLYDGTSAMTGGTVSIDGAHMAASAAAARYLTFTFSQEVTLAANTTYRLALKPSQTTSSITLHYFDVNAAGHMQAHSGGAAWIINSRIDLGAWGTATTTRRPFMGIRVSSIDDGVQVGNPFQLAGSPMMLPGY